MSLLIKEFHALLLADLVLTVLTLEHLVGALPESLRVSDEGDLPADEEHHGHEEKTPGEKVPHEKHGREDHEISPVEYPAVYATAVLDEESLEGTVDDHAYQVADEKRS